eukprot:TRINITY_DN16042_c0_g1_i1.p3 TRINITY_DN16042_c0_g1~~TRINITY_DN16042_c0_g1_i1.p3  ORF type:complete len:129 (-),score=18.12 TRINITY_DN16042_c0_g1_i1:168-554(-)
MYHVVDVMKPSAKNLTKLNGKDHHCDIADLVFGIITKIALAADMKSFQHWNNEKHGKTCCNAHLALNVILAQSLSDPDFQSAQSVKRWLAKKGSPRSNGKHLIPKDIACTARRYFEKTCCRSNLQSLK